MADGSRNFGEIPDTVFFDKIRDYLRNLEGASETAFVSDRVTEMWLDIDYRGHNFAINNQNGLYWFFVDDPLCPDEILLDLLTHFEKLIQ